MKLLPLFSPLWVGVTLTGAEDSYVMGFVPKPQSCDAQSQRDLRSGIAMVSAST